MDERVYDVEVCSACFTQVAHDADGNWDPCPHCGSLESPIFARYEFDVRLAN